MALQKRGNIWWVRLTHSGKRIQQSTGTQNKVEAQRIHDQLKADLWKHTYLNEKPRRTWKEAVLRWKNENQHKKSLRDDLDKIAWLNSYFNSLYLDQINRDLIEKIIQFKLKEKVANATVNRLLSFISAVLRKAWREWEYIDRVPVIRQLKEPNHRIRWISKQEAVVLLKELPRHLSDMAAFSLYTGLREANVRNLKWKDIDLTRGHLSIHADESKTEMALAIPLNKSALQVLQSRIGIHPKYVFTYKGQPVTKCNTKAWKKAIERAGIKEFRWHDLRHTYASWLVMDGVSLDTVKQLLGHKNIQTTLRYAHLSSEHLKQAAEKVELTLEPELRRVK